MPLYSDYGGYLLDLLSVGSGDSYCEGVDRITMQEYFFNISCLEVSSFNLIGSNVLALLELENIFLSINDLEP